MAILALKVLDKDSNTICVSSGEDFVDLVCTHTYEEGDRIVLETDEKNIHVHLQVDDALGRCLRIHNRQRILLCSLRGKKDQHVP